MTEAKPKRAVIYCRVSSTKQTTHGNGLDSQETRCREYARYHGHEVVEVFSDDISGSVAGRPGMKAMLKYLQARRKSKTVVIIDDISRLARGLEAHIRLRSALASAGAILESPSIEFGEDSDSQLVENLLASVSQHQRQKNGEQTTNRMRARMLNGYWVFQAPLGYRFERQSGGGRRLVSDEPFASIIKEALEGFANGRFGSRAEVKYFLESKPLFPTGCHGVVTNERVNHLLNQMLYTGHIEYPKWDVPLRKAQHEGIITLETYERIQARLQVKPYAPARKDLHADFPLRGIVCCADCDEAMTACWSKGRSSHYPYYICRQRGCPSNKKSVARDKMEDGLRDLVNALTPSHALFELASEIFRDLWDEKLDSSKEEKTHLRVEISNVEKKVSQLLERIMDAENTTVIKAYEGKLDSLERKKLILREKIEKCGTPIRDYQSSFQTALKFLANPWNLWETGRIEDRRAMMKLVFGGRITFDRKSGFQTPEISLPFKMLTGLSSPEKGMVRRAVLSEPVSAGKAPKTAEIRCFRR